MRFAQNASKYYKLYSIKKRGGGDRLIAHPTPELKATQRWVVKHVFSEFSVHESAFAYQPGSNIRKHAHQHLGTLFTLHVDFKNFFDNISSDHILKFLNSNHEFLSLSLSGEDTEFVARIATRYGRMTIGAPSSPRISNVLMHDFDCILSQWAQSRSQIYTRYADDIYVSTRKPNVLYSAKEKIFVVAKSYKYADLTINEAKTALLSRRYRRSVTGLNITPDGKISIGRAKKRFIRSMLYKYFKNELSQSEIEYLKGMLAFVQDVEPSFIISLENKYSRNLLHRISDN